jgi:hypothetical protein
MALTLDQLQAERDALLEIIGKGIRRIQFSDRLLEYETQAEMEAAVQRIDREIAALQSPKSRQFTIQTNRGI